MNLKGRVAVVSGGASGIGRATVLALIERGARVVVADLDEEGGRQTVEMVARAGGAAVFRRCDVTKTADLASAFGSAVQEFGQLDVVFNNAGIGDGDLFADEAGDWRRVIEIDLMAVIDGTRLAVRAMQRSGSGGVIINTASLIGLEPMGSAPVYGAAKAGVVNFTRALGYLAEESSIRVNAVCPELVATAMTRPFLGDQADELVRKGEVLAPEDIAAAVVELIEDESRFGAVMKVTTQGGREYATP